MIWNADSDYLIQRIARICKTCVTMNAWSKLRYRIRFASLRLHDSSSSFFLASSLLLEWDEPGWLNEDENEQESLPGNREAFLL